MKFVKFSPLLILFSSCIHAKDVVELIGPYNVSSEKAQSSVINFYVPEDSVAVIGLTGGDTFDEVNTGKGIIHDHTKNRKTLYLKNNLKPGFVSSSGINTECGLSLSVIIHSLDNTQANDIIQPKLVISTGAACIKED